MRSRLVGKNKEEDTHIYGRHQESVWLDAQTENIREQESNNGDGSSGHG